MPISALQHRSSIGNYQYDFNNNPTRNSRHIQVINKNESIITKNKIRLFGSSISRAINSCEEIKKISHQNIVPKQGITAPLLMLFCHIRLVDNPFSTNTNNAALISNNVISCSDDRNIDCSLSSNSYFGGVLSPFVNALYKTGQFISRHDPLKFPQAEAATTPVLSKCVYEIQNSSINEDLFYGITKGHVPTGAPVKPIILFISTFQQPVIPKESPPGEINQAVHNDVYKKYIANNCHVRTKTNAGTVVGDTLLVSSEITRNTIRAIAEKIYKAQMGGHEMPEWLVTFTVAANSAYDIVLGVMSLGVFPLVKYSSAKALSVAGQAVNNDMTCLENEFSAEELAMLLFDIEVGITHRHINYHPFSLSPHSNRLKFTPDGIYVHQNTANHINTVKYMTVNHHGTVWSIREKKPGEYWTYHPHAVKSELLEKRVYFDAVNDKIHFNSEMPDAHGLDYDMLDGKKFINIYGENHEITWNWNKNQPEIVLREKDNDLVSIPVYMEPLSKTWHPSIHGHHEFFRARQKLIIDRLKIKKDQSSVYIPKMTKGDGRIYAHEKLDDSGHKIVGYYIEINGELVPARKITHEGKEISYEIYNLNRANKKGHPIEWDGNRWLFKQKTSACVAKDLKKAVQPDMFSKNINAGSLTPPDHYGLMRDTNGNSYVKINNEFLKIKQRDGHFYTNKNHGGIIHLEYRKGKFHLASDRYRLSLIIKTGFSGRHATSKQLIANKLKISMDEVENIFSKYDFDAKDSNFNEVSFTSYLQEHGTLPGWAKNYKKIDLSDYSSPFKGRISEGNGLYGFNDNDGYYYRVDMNKPEYILANGFDESSDFGAISKMTSAGERTVIASESLEGAKRFHTSSRSAYIYKINARNIQGVSLKMNLYENQEGLNIFLNNKNRKYSTINDFANDCSGAIFLEEIHLRKDTIDPRAISVVSQEEIDKVLEPGPWYYWK